MGENRIKGFEDGENIQNTLARLMEIADELNGMMDAGTTVEIKIIEKPAIITPGAQAKVHTIIISKPRVLLQLQPKGGA